MSLKPLATILMLLSFLPASAFSVDCSDAYSYADDAYTQAKRGYNSDTLQNVREAREGLSQYFSFYNTERFHSSLGNYTPEEVYVQRRTAF